MCKAVRDKLTFTLIIVAVAVAVAINLADPNLADPLYLGLRHLWRGPD